MILSDKETAIRKGYSRTKEDLELKVLGALVLSFFLPFIGPMIVFAMAVKNTFKKTVYFTRTEAHRHPPLVPIRFAAGTADILIVPAGRHELRNTRLKAATYYIFAVGSFVLHLIVWQAHWSAAG
ncbi:MAG: hypothetical protein BGO88_03100 [Flavobacterium sp. 38-13]|uniref:hypothetical protein n=1 Tax=Flavobacterium sp. 38-13 TaxID=1896168 RepID=UPI0009628A8D|nr:hypothetical protein [Flavobacterium sp. 38-13]OJX54875.1 MAG: hypothetical protein BGO88_03100 [Flavobacterium sp. 38-13]